MSDRWFNFDMEEGLDLPRGASDEEIYRAAEDHDTYVRGAFDPAGVTRFYNMPQATVFPTGNDDYGVDDPADIKFINQATERRAGAAAFAEQVEQAYFENRGEIPLTWWLEQDPSDLALMSGMPGVATELHAIQRHMAEFTRLQEEEEAAFTAELNARLDRRELWRELSRRGLDEERISDILREPDTVLQQLEESFRPDPTLGGGLQGPSADYSSVRLEQLQEDLRGMVRNRLIVTGQYGASMSQMGVGTESGRDPITGALGWTLGKTLDGVGWLANLPGELGEEIFGEDRIATFRDWRQSEWNRQVEGIREERAAFVEENPFVNQASQVFYRSLTSEWQQMAAEGHPLVDELRAMAGGNEVMAMGLFGASVEEEKTAREQILDIAAKLEDEEMDFFRQLEERNFTPGEDLLFSLAWYNRTVVMPAATYTSILIDDAVQGKFPAFLGAWEEKNKYDTPSEYFGMEGTFLGMSLDFMGSLAMDPINWVSAPSGAGRALLDDAARVANYVRRNRAMRAVIRDISRTAAAPDMGPVALAAQLDWLAGTPQYAELLEVLEIQPQVLGGRRWVSSPYGSRASLVDADALSGLGVSLRTGPEGVMSVEEALEVGAREIMSFSDNPTPLARRVAARTDELRNAGFRAPIQVNVNPTNGAIWISNDDDLVTLAVVRYMDDMETVRKVPVVFREVDSAPPEAAVRLSDWADAMRGRTKEQGFLLDLTPESLATETLDDTQRTLLSAARRGGGKDEKVGATFYLPDLIGQEHFLADLGKDEVMSLVERAMLNGASMPTAANVMTSVGLGGSVRRFFSKWDGGKSFEKYMTSRLMRNKLQLRGPAAMKEHLNQVWTMWGENPEKLEYWMGRLLEIHKDQGKWAQGMVNYHVSLQEKGDLLRTLQAEVDGIYPTTMSGAFDKEEMARLQSEAPLTQARQSAERTAKQLDNVDEFADHYRRGIYAQEGIDTSVPLAPEIEARINAQVEEFVSRLSRNKERAEREFLALESRYEGVRTQLADAEIAFGKELDELRRNIHAQPVTPERYQEFFDELLTDYNRTVIAPAWRKDFKTPEELKKFQAATGSPVFRTLDDGTEILDWDLLRPGRRAPSVEDPRAGATFSSQADLTPKELKNLEQHIATHATVLRGEHSINLLAKPFDLLAASGVTGRKWRQFTAKRAGASAREFGQWIQSGWIFDKIFRPSTFIRVNLEETLRMFHRYGPQMWGRWMADRVLFAGARVNYAVRNPLKTFTALNPTNVNAVRLGARGRAARRIADLDNAIPTYLRKAQRQTISEYNLGWRDLAPGESLDAAQAWLGALTSDSAFQAAVQGEEAFTAWWLNVDNITKRSLHNVIDLKELGSGKVVTNLIQDAKQAYEGWSRVIDYVLQEFKGAERTAALGELRRVVGEVAKNGRPMNVADWLANRIHARGVVRTRTLAGLPTLKDNILEAGFLNPAQYRAGLLADWVGRIERQRIERLLMSQERRIVDEAQILNFLNLDTYRPGMAHLGYREGVSDFIYDMTGNMTRQQVEDMVEMRVQDELAHVLYSWDLGSQMGQSGVTKAAFPFGKPWGDMIGFWGREFFTQMQARPWLNKVGLGDLVQGVFDRIPVNLRVPAMMSRLANTSLEFQEGQREYDLGNLLFLPTEGSNPFVDLGPPFGVVPLLALDYFIENHLTEGMDDPAEYKRALEAWGQFVGFIDGENMGGNLIQRFLGGGNIQTMLGGVNDAWTGWSGSPVRGLNDFLESFGDQTQAMSRNRALDAIMADPSVWEEMAEYASKDGVDAWLFALVDEAAKEGAWTNFAGRATRFATPVRVRQDTLLTEVYDAWLGALDSFPEYFHVREDIRLLGDPRTNIDAKRAVGNEVRRTFFNKLTPIQRQIVLEKHPEIVVNLVGSWSWTDEAETVPELADELLEGPFSTGGNTSDDIARFELYRRNGWIRPATPRERLIQMVGRIRTNRGSLTRTAYGQVTANVNRVRWDGGEEFDRHVMLGDTEFRVAVLRDRSTFQPVSAESKAAIAQAVQAFGAEIGIPDTPEGHYQMWLMAGSIDMTERYLDSFARSRGLSRDELTGRVLDVVKTSASIPQAEQAWGEDWPGTDPEELAQRWRGFPISSFVGDESREIFDALGVEIGAGVTMDQMFDELRHVVLDEELDNPIWSEVVYEYNRIRQGRAAEFTTARNQLMHLANWTDNITEGYREDIQNFLLRWDGLRSQLDERAVYGLTRAEQEKVLEDFNQIALLGPQSLQWDRIWKEEFENLVGPRDYTFPVPRSPFDDTGHQVHGSWQPYIRYVPDGDTLIVQNRPEPGHAQPVRLHAVRLLGVRARDFTVEDEGAVEDRARLITALTQARNEGVPVYLVRDPDFTGRNVDLYGRELAWLWIGDEPFYFEEDLRRGD